MLHRRLALLIAAFFAFAPATAFAASATQEGYENDDEVVQEDDGDGGTNPAADDETADATPTATGTTSLPFTGMEAGLIAVAGLGLAGTGVALRRVGREQQQI